MKIETEQKTFPMYIGVDIFPKLGEIYQIYGYGRHALLVADERLKDNFGELLCLEFGKKNIELTRVTVSEKLIEGGMHSISEMTRLFLSAGLKSGDTVVSMGGSRLLHFVGFAAGLIHGGVQLIEVPTSLVAQVVTSTNTSHRLNFDSMPELLRVDGKVNLVWSDVAFLKTLPDPHFIAGLGYILKYACLIKNGLFEFMESQIERILKKDLDLIEEIVHRSCETQNTLVRNHRKDRSVLLRTRFGDDTSRILRDVAHPSIRYGEALFFGMLIDVVIAYKLGIFSGRDFERYYEILKRFPLQYLLDRIQGEDLLRAVSARLNTETNYTLPLPKEIGDFVQDSPVQLADYEYAINLIFAE
ncbi:MAG: 3-dehydroquinate synthase family protein [Candidatus Zhuqueibacterota bacterium]